LVLRKATAERDSGLEHAHKRRLIPENLASKTDPPRVRQPDDRYERIVATILVTALEKVKAAMRLRCKGTGRSYEMVAVLPTAHHQAVPE
jgi:hypothetical protein